MTENTAKSVQNLGYHTHIYYDPTRTRAVAEGVCAALGEQCQVEIEAFRDTPRGPHPRANVLVIFTPDQFAQVVPYLMVHRAGLDVLVHPPDRGRGGGPHGFRDVARQAGRTEHSHAAPRARRAAAERRQRLALEEEGDAARRKADLSRACSRAYDQPEAGRRWPLLHCSSRRGGETRLRQGRRCRRADRCRGSRRLPDLKIPRLRRKFCSRVYEGAVAPVCMGIKQRGSRTVRPQ